MIRTLIETMRPEQWTKKLFLFAELIFSQSLFQCDFNEGQGIGSYFVSLWNMGLLFMSRGKSVPAGPVFLAFLPFLIFLPKIDRRIKWMLLYSFFFSLLWYIGLQSTRHFLPAIGLLSIITAYTAYRLMDTGQYLKGYVSILLVLMLSFNLASTIRRNIISINPIYLMCLGWKPVTSFYKKLFGLGAIACT